MLVPLQVDAAVLAGAVVLVEVHGELLVPGPGPHRGVGRIAEVLAHVGARAEEPLLLARPERDADGAPGPRVEGGQDAHRLEHHRHARGVVAGVRARVPGIEVGPDHDQLVRQVGARDLPEHVGRLLDLVADRVAHLDLDLRRQAPLRDPHQPVVVLGRHRDNRQRLERFPPRPPVHLGARAGEPTDRAGPAAARLQEHRCPLRPEERHALRIGEQVGIRHRGQPRHLRQPLLALAKLGLGEAR